MATSFPAYSAPATTVLPGTTVLNPIAAAAPAYYDTPAPNRLRPWLVAGCLLLMLIGVGMLITAAVHLGSITSLWGIFAAGIALALTGLLGMVFTSIRKPAVAAFFLVWLVAIWIGSLAVLIVNAIVLDGNMAGQCANNGEARFSAGCERRRDYHITIFSVFGPLVAVYTPILIAAAAEYRRVLSLYRKQEYPAHAALSAPVGGSRM